PCCTSIRRLNLCMDLDLGPGANGLVCGHPQSMPSHSRRFDRPKNGV
ncbi:uncharacterized protein METZ01_LOCUS188563, partial [marine metagenome]